MFKLLNYITNNKFEAFITFCVLSNLFPFFLSPNIYYLGLFLLAYKMSQMGVRRNKNATLFILFILLIAISSLVNMMLDLRMVLFAFVLFLTCPIYTSLKWHLYKRKIMKCLFVGFVGVVIINMYAKITGFNLRAITQQWEDLTDKQFSGFCDQPMWLSAASAVASIYCANLVFSQIKKNNQPQTIKNGNLTLVANPKDIQSIVASCDIYLCPIKLGGGLKLRVMDGFRNGLPVLAHAVSARGYRQFEKDGVMAEFTSSDQFKTELSEMLEKITNGEITKQGIIEKSLDCFSFTNILKRMEKVLMV